MKNVEVVRVGLERFLAMRDELEAVKRSEWRVPVQAWGLGKMCESRAEFHAGRVTHWRGEQKRLGEAVRESGLELREQQVTGGPRFAATVDQELGRQYAEANSRLSAHRSARDLYARWVRFFNAAPGEREFHLSAEDLAFFSASPEGVDEE